MKDFMRITTVVICLLFVFVTVSYGQEDPFADIVTQIVPDVDGSLWLATLSGAVHIIPDGNVANLWINKNRRE